jgi:hypothetical protein
MSDYTCSRKYCHATVGEGIALRTKELTVMLLCVDCWVRSARQIRWKEEDKAALLAEA